MPKPFPFRIDAKLKHKLDKLASTLAINDIWIIIDGDEGSGKTNTAAYILYYYHCLLDRPFDVSNMYFDSDALFEWVKVNDKGLVNWDEAALGGLSSEWWNKSQRNLLKFAMTGRKKHHIFVLCIPKCDKLAEYLRVDRSHALIHMDLGKKKNRHGHYMYLTRRGKIMLNRIWAKTKFRAYEKCMRKYGGFAGDIPFVFPKIVDELAYDKKKDDAIANIGKKDNNKYKDKLEDWKIRLSSLDIDPEVRKHVAKALGTTPDAMRMWRQRHTPSEKEPNRSTDIFNNGDTESIDKQPSEATEEDESI